MLSVHTGLPEVAARYCTATMRRRRLFTGVQVPERGRAPQWCSSQSPGDFRSGL